MFNIDLNSFDSSVSKLFNDKYIMSSILILLTLYISLISSKIPKSWGMIIDTPLYKLFIMFIISYLSLKNMTIALITSIAFLITLNTVQSHDVNDKILGLIIIDTINKLNNDNIIVKSPSDNNQSSEIPPLVVNQSSDNNQYIDYSVQGFNMNPFANF